MAHFQGYTVERIGSYKIIEGIGRFGGLFAAHSQRLRDLEVFNSRSDAKEHALIVLEDVEWL